MASSSSIEMHSLLRKMGKEIVHAQSNAPGEREFLMDAKDICDLLKNNTGTNKVLGIALDMGEMNELQIHDIGFKKFHNLLFLQIYIKHWSQKRLTIKWDTEWHLPQKLRWLKFDGYPRRCMPSQFCPQNLVKLEMQRSKLVRLWEGVHTLGGLKEIDLSGSIYVKEIPNLSKVTNLEKLSLDGCLRLKTFPNFSTNIELLNLSQTGIEEVPWWIENFTKLKIIRMWGCSNLVRVSLNFYKLKQLDIVDFRWCEALCEASWNDHPIAIDEVLSSVEIPSYFTHKTTGYSLTNIPLRPTSLSQRLFKFKACVVVVFDDEWDEYDFANMIIDVDCRFKDRLGNTYRWVSENRVLLHFRRDSVLFVLDYLIPPDERNDPLAQVNYDYVDMEIYICDSWLKAKRWGIQVLEE